MRSHPAARYATTVVALAGLFTFLSLAVKIVQPANAVSLVYPATGLGAALLWGFGLRWWPAIIITQAILTFQATRSPWVTGFVTSTELLVTLLFYVAMVRLRVLRDLRRVRDLAVFTLGALLTTSIGGVATVVGEYFFETTNVRQLISDGTSFWLSDFVSILIFVPLVLGWRRWPFATRARFFRWLALTIPLIAIGVLIAFNGQSASAALFLLLPLVVFTAIAAGIPGASASGAVLLFIFIGMHLGQEPDPVNSIIRVVFVATATATGYILAVVWGERERNAKRLYELAHHDPLTGMVNRYELERRLQTAVEAGPPSAHALLYLDLDQFKLVNDTCGHIAGDRMLQELAAELQRVAPRGGKFARLGGDEFACIVLDATADDAQALANAIHDTMGRYRFRVGSLSFAVGVSIGITFFPAEDGDSADAVLGRADIACYVAKEDGRHRSHVYLPRDEAMLQWHSSIQKVSQLEMAMENGSLQLWRQSIVDITGGPPTHFGEVLLRLEEGGSIRTSGDFLPLAQRFGLMDRIDRWVIENVCRYLAGCGDGNATKQQERNFVALLP